MAGFYSYERAPIIAKTDTRFARLDMDKRNKPVGPCWFHWGAGGLADKLRSSTSGAK